MAAPERTKARFLPYNPEGGSDIVVATGVPDEVVRLWRDGEAFPRIVIDVQNNQMLFGNGTVAPVAVAGGLPETPLSVAHGGTAQTTLAALLTSLSGIAVGDFSLNSHKLTALADGTALTDAATINNLNTIPINAQSGTTYTLVLSDAGKLVVCSNAAAIALTVPANASVAFPVGTQIPIEQGGAGQVTVGITTDTLNARVGKKLAGQFAQGLLTKETPTTWTPSGDLSA